MRRSLLPIKLDTRWLLIDSHWVREILGAAAWLPIPKARPDLPGVIAFRGRAVPLVDLAPIFGLARLAPRQARARTAIIELGKHWVALPVDAAREVQHFSQDDLHGVHACTAPYASAEVHAGSIPMPVIDLEALLNDIAQAHSEDLDGAAL